MLEKFRYTASPKPTDHGHPRVSKGGLSVAVLVYRALAGCSGGQTLRILSGTLVESSTFIAELQVTIFTIFHEVFNVIVCHTQ